jgi:hypothetical protein
MEARDGTSPCDPAAAKPSPLSGEDVDLLEDIAAGVDKRLAGMGLLPVRPGRENVSFVIDCRARLKERLWDPRRQRRICAALEQRHLAAGWQHASIYVMEHDHLRLRVTLRAHPSRRPSAR